MKYLEHALLQREHCLNNKSLLKQVTLVKNCSRTDFILHRMFGKYREWELALEVVLESNKETNSQTSEGTSHHRCDEEHQKVYSLQRAGHLPKVFRL